jgi:hypothetical protein
MDRDGQAQESKENIRPSIIHAVMPLSFHPDHLCPCLFILCSPPPVLKRDAIEW